MAGSGSVANHVRKRPVSSVRVHAAPATRPSIGNMGGTHKVIVIVLAIIDMLGVELAAIIGHQNDADEFDLYEVCEFDVTMKTNMAERL